MTLTPADPKRPSFIDRLFSRAQVSMPPRVHIITEPARDRERDSGILASARRLSGKDIESRNKAAQGGARALQPWQEEAWELNDWVGEQRFLGNTLAGRMSQAVLYVGKISPDDSPGTRPAQTEDKEISAVLDAIGGGRQGQGQMLHRMGVNLFVAGEGWFVGIPPYLMPGTPENIAAAERAKSGRAPVQVSRSESPEEIDSDISKLHWRMLSSSEVSVDQSGVASLILEEGDKIEAPVDALYLIRVWRPHPRYASEADSPTRASLPVLRELLGLTQQVSAQIDSRLAGAGLLLISSTASASLKRAAGLPEDSVEDPLLEALMDAMMTPIKDRSSASAVVPLTITVPDEVVDKVKHLTFSTPLDKEAVKLREEAIRRLALGQDAPPELLLGTSGMNHWGAWLVREDVVTTHLEPPLSLTCDALTTQYLRPILIGMGMSPEEAEEYVVWYDVDHLIARPNRSGDAKDLHAAGVISDEALREATGFEDADAPVAVVEQDLAVTTALEMVGQAPSLAQVPGIESLVAQLRAVLGGAASPAAAPVAEAPAQADGEGSIPDTDGDEAPAGTPANPEGGAE